VGSTAVTNLGDVDRFLVLLIEEYAVVATTETEAVNGGLNFFTSPLQLANLIAVSQAIAGRSAGASGDQITPIRWVPDGSVIHRGRTRAGCLREKSVCRMASVVKSGGCDQRP